MTFLHVFYNGFSGFDFSDFHVILIIETRHAHPARPQRDLALLACLSAGLFAFSLFRKKKKKRESLEHVIVSFVGILGPTGSHRPANGSFWMPFLTKGDARQDGKQSNKSKKEEEPKTGKTCRGFALPGPGGRKVGPQ